MQKNLLTLPTGDKVPKQVLAQIPQHCNQCGGAMRAKRGWRVNAYNSRTGEPNTFEAALTCTNKRWWAMFSYHDAKLAIWRITDLKELKYHVTILVPRF